MPRTPWMEPSTLAPGWRLRISSVAPTTVWLMTAVGPPPCAMTNVPAMLDFSRRDGFQSTLACLAGSRNGSFERRPHAAWGPDDDGRTPLGHAAVERECILVGRASTGRRRS